jgi:hypothetical protein
LPGYTATNTVERVHQPGSLPLRASLVPRLHILLVRGSATWTACE